MDGNVAVRWDVPLWNETRWNGCWNPEAGAGLYLHAGRFRKDLDMWWAQTVAYLPDCALAVDRSWGRNSSDAGVRFGNFELEMTADGWTSRFDGVGELTSIDDLARGPRGSAEPVVRVQWEVSATAVTPVWDIYAGAPAQKQDFAGDTHVQGGYRTAGTLRVDGTEYALDGVGFKDHSSGPPLHIVTVDGEELVLTAEQVHALPMTMTPDNNYINGIGWDGPGDPIALVEGISRITTADGIVGHAHLERSARCSVVKRPADG